MIPPATILAAATGAFADTAASTVLSPYMGVFFTAFAVSFVLTPLMRKLAVAKGIVDWPDFKRKTHIEPVAYLGGIGIFLGWLAGMGVSYFVQPHHAELTSASLISSTIPIIIGAFVITVIGLIDDVYGISPRVKIGGQLIAAAALAQLDVGTQLMSSVFAVGGFDAPHGLAYVLGAVVIGLFVIGGCNSVNLLDGLDGLASGVVAIACMGFLFIATTVSAVLLDGSDPVAVKTTADLIADPVRIILCLSLLGALLGFLPYNFNPANIFMGDAGSLLLGYLGVSIILLFTHVPHSGPLLVMAALIVFALPITDTALAIFRRQMRRQPIFSPDNQHLHHQILKTGLSVKRTVLVLYALAAFFAVLGGSLIFLRWRFVLAVFGVMFGFIMVTAYKSGHRQQVLQKLREAESQPAAPPAEIASPAAAPLPAATPTVATPPAAVTGARHGSVQA